MSLDEPEKERRVCDSLVNALRHYDLELPSYATSTGLTEAHIREIRSALEGSPIEFDLNFTQISGESFVSNSGVKSLFVLEVGSLEIYATAGPSPENQAGLPHLINVALAIRDNGMAPKDEELNEILLSGTIDNIAGSLFPLVGLENSPLNFALMFDDVAVPWPKEDFAFHMHGTIMTVQLPEGHYCLMLEE